MAADGKIYIGVDHRVTFKGVEDDTGTPLGAGTCTYRLLSGTTVVTSGTLTLITGTDSDYEGMIDGALLETLKPGAVYFLEVKFVEDQYNDLRRVNLEAAYRGYT